MPSERRGHMMMFSEKRVSADLFVVRSRLSGYVPRTVNQSLALQNSCASPATSSMKLFPWLRPAAAILIAGLATAPFFASAQPQRVLGTDVSYWQSEISQAGWNSSFSTHNRKFAQIRATRGGTTGVDQPQGTPGGGSLATDSHRYDDPRFVQNLIRATAAGFIVGPYHFARPDVAGNTGADEADHLIQMAGAWMRPGYMMPMYDLEATSGSNNWLRVFSIEFSERLYEVMKIRPNIYINGNYSGLLDSGATLAQRDALAKPAALTPSVISPCFPMLWNARYSDNTANWVNIPVQTGEPKTTYTTVGAYYGAWDDYGNAEPWSFWQYASVADIGLGDATCDVNVSHGDMEYVRNYLVPAVWWNDNDGNWSTLANWNSGQTPVAPISSPGQAAPYATGGLPTARLPGAAGSGPTSGQYDTVILERPSANIIVTLSTGTHNVRKLYMRETLNLTGGSLTINYDPAYRADDSTEVLHGGPISAQFSGPVTLSNSASLTLHTLQVDTNRIFTLAGGTLTFNTINLMPHASVPAKILMNGDVTFNPLSNVTAIITNGAGTGLIDLVAGTRAFNVGNGTSDVDLSINVPIINGGLTKTGAGTLRLGGNNTFAGNVTINGGTLRYGHASGLSSSAVVTVNNGGILDMNGITDSVAALASTAGQTTGVITQGSAGLTLGAASGTNTFSGTVIGSGAFIKNGASMQILNGNNSLGAAIVNTGSLLLNGNNTTLGVTVNSGGALGGTGTITGAVTVNSGGTVSPGASIGTLTLNSAPIMNGNTFMEIDRNGGSSLADKIVLTSGTLTYGGSLVVSNAGAVLTGGEVFTLFNAPAYAGSFVSSNLPSLTAGLNWYTGLLVTNGTIKVNRSPLASPLAYTNTAPSVLQIPFAVLIANATDADVDALSVAGVNLVSTNGVVLTTNATSLTYSNHASVTDQLSYVLSDGRGGSVTGLVSVVNIGSSPTAQFTTAPSVDGSSVELHFTATPGWTYYLERSTNLPAWVTIWTNVAPPSGVFDYTDDFHDLSGPPAAAFYRLRWLP